MDIENLLKPAEDEDYDETDYWAGGGAEEEEPEDSGEEFDVLTQLTTEWLSNSGEREKVNT